ncbi:MAG: EF-P beta-lysylation protein EpmB [Gammaproteobacteria bacterium]|nr:EF-P beta-lysylation protein EpmB [Gammaproteobacteria bacterium]
MIHANPEPIQEPDWQAELRAANLRSDALLAALGLPASLATDVAAFPLRVPPGFLARMRHGDPDDPLLRQVLPTVAEQTAAPGFCADPVGDLDAVVEPGVLRKYRGRALVMTTGACAVHCRFCFRRAFPYGDQAGVDPERLGPILAGLPDVDELILSGGDPLTLADRRLFALIAAAEAVPRLRRLRLHTRVPVVLPTRVTEALCARLAASRLAVVVVIHANHPAEFDATVDAGLARLRDAGATLLNQSVLLRGINDDVATLERLATRLFAAGVLPYYLHMLDRTAGTAHFEVDDASAIGLHRELVARLPGYLVPRLVREVPGDLGKQSLEREAGRP